ENQQKVLLFGIVFAILARGSNPKLRRIGSWESKKTWEKQKFPQTYFMRGQRTTLTSLLSEKLLKVLI
ncbi:hypothetical protein, partial [Dialister invisus]